MIKLIGHYTLFLVIACLGNACDNNPEINSYEYQVEQFVAQAGKAYSDTSQLVDYNELTTFADSIQYADVSAIEFTLSSGEKLTLGDVQMPIVIETFASWCSPCISALPALNQLAKAYKGEAMFIIITQEPKKTFKDQQFTISEDIKLVHANEGFKSSNIVYLTSGNFQSVLPFPSMYFINSQLEIAAVKIGAPRVGSFGSTTYSKEAVHEMNLERIETELAAIMIP